MITEVRDWDKNPLRKRLVVDGGCIVRDDTDWPSFERFEFFRRDGQTTFGASNVFDLLTSLADRGAALFTGFIDGHRYEIGSKTDHEFVRGPTNVYICEIDGLPFLDGYTNDDLIRDPERVLDAHIRHYHRLPETTSYVAVLSSSAGLGKDEKPPSLRYHLYLALNREHLPHEIDYMDDVHVRVLGDAFDLNIRKPSQFLLVAPPEIEGRDDPFPTRIFYSKREHDHAQFRFPEEFDQFEEAKIMQSRGRSRAMPRLNDEAFASESYRTEAAHKWVATMRYRDPNMTWQEAKPLFEAELLRVDASRDAWARLGGVQLTEVERMWTQFSFRGKGDHTSYALLPYREPAGSVDEAYRLGLEELERCLQEPGQYLFKLPLGTGKTQQIVEKATREKKNAIILTPSIERCEEIAARLNREEERRRHLDEGDWWDFDTRDQDGLPFQVWKGRSQPGMCARAETAETVHKMGASVHRDLCGHGQEIKCPHFHTCPHARQYDDFGHVRWVVPSNTIIQNRRLGNEAKVVFIDEGVTQYLTSSTTFELSDLLTPREPRLDALSKRVHAALVDGDTDTVGATDFGLTRAEIEEARDLELSLKPELHIAPNMSDDQIGAEVDRLSGKWHPALYAFWSQLLAEFDLERDFVNSIHKYWARDVQAWKVRVAWRVETKLLNEDQTVVLFDATPNELVLRQHFPDLETIEFDAPNRNVHVAQVLNMSGRDAQFIAMSEKPKEQERARKARENLAKWLRAQPGYTVCILKKAVRELIEDEHDFERVAFGHYGAVQGQDEWTFGNGLTLKGAEIDNLVLMGRSAPPAWDVEALAMGHFWDGPKVGRIPVPENGIPWYERRERVVADGYAGFILRHPDERCDAILRDIWHSSQMQAFGRGRATRREKPLRVIIGHHLALDVEVAEAMTEQELHARIGDAILLSPKEVARVFGYSGRFVEKIERVANVKYWVREGQTQPYQGWVREGLDLEVAMQPLGALRWESTG